MSGYTFQFLKLCKTRTRRLIFWMWMLSSVVIVFQTFILHSRHGMSYSIIPLIEERLLPNKAVFSKSTSIRNFYPLRSMRNTSYTPLVSHEVDAKETLLKTEELEQRIFSSSTLNSTHIGISWIKKKMPPVYLSDMNTLLLRTRASHQSERPRWSSACDKRILSAKEHIDNAPIVKNDRELYAPLFRNISMFKRSYELMQQNLKIYVYREGDSPIFHRPLLKGIYASEGWFMKLMEADRHFVVKDPSKAHLFYLPISSRQLQFALYTEESHYRSSLEQYMKNYVHMIAAKYPFWNRTGGADHFLVACHDWAPFEMRYTTGHSIRALCNADLRSGFRLGIDVSLPETNMDSPSNPLRGLGGRPANRRPTLAFFAGKMHGGLRPKLLRHWENKDSDMKIFGLLSGQEGTRKTDYIQYMKTSKYCICPRGHEVNSPRVVESIFYECVPVIISNNYVPPFFEVLNWEAFSVFVSEKHVPRLKEILESIPEENYVALQKGVRKVQKHFLWHGKPVKYDLFHMILHSIWLNRVYQIEYVSILEKTQVPEFIVKDVKSKMALLRNSDVEENLIKVVLDRWNAV